MTSPDPVNVELEHCAVAVFTNSDSLVKATAQLKTKGYEHFILEGEEGRESLQPKHHGLAGAVQKMAAAFGDELRIIDRLDRALAEGHQVLIVKTEDDKTAVTEMLTDLGGEFLWQFRGWTFNSAGTAEEA